MNFVLDASVTLAWLFEDESSPVTEAILDRLAHERAVVPDLWLYEISNVLVVGERRHRLTEAQSHRFMELLLDLPIETISIAQTTTWMHLVGLAREHNISAYDASYLEAAMRLGLPLATQDKMLKKAAMRAGVVLL